MKLFDPFLEPWLHKLVKDQLLDSQLDWNYPNFGRINLNEEPNLDLACFGRCAYHHDKQIVNWNRVESLTYVLDYWIEENKDWFEFKGLDRCMMNFFAKGQHAAWHDDHWHPDLYSLLFYVNDGGGGTEFSDKLITHKENTAVFFNSSLRHRPVPSDKPRRITVNYIFAGKIKND